MINAPNRPMEIADADPGAPRSFTCYTAPGVTFSTEEEMKEHYRSEWHRTNLKRKVAGLPPLGRAAYEERAAREQQQQQQQVASGAAAVADAPPGASLDAVAAEAAGAQQEKHNKAASNPRSKAAHYEATKEMSENEYIAHKMATAEPYDEGSDLFSRHVSPSLEANLAHMAKAHGFFIPYMEYVKDLPGLLGYLLEMVYVGNVALVTGKQFHSLDACQAHMRDSGGCRIELEGHEEEYEDYYDMVALAEKSPLWEWVEVEAGSDDDDDDDGWEDDDGDGAAPMEEDEEDELGALFERCVALALLSEAQADKLTDCVASGERGEAELIAEWRAKLAAAAPDEAAALAAAASGRRAAAAAADDGDAMSIGGASSRPTTMQVRYRPVGEVSEAGSSPFAAAAAAAATAAAAAAARRSSRSATARCAPFIGKSSSRRRRRSARPIRSCTPSWCSMPRRACSRRITRSSRASTPTASARATSAAARRSSAPNTSTSSRGSTTTRRCAA